MKKYFQLLSLSITLATVTVSAQPGIITTVAGTHAAGVTAGNGGPATDAGLGNIRGLAVDIHGNIYIVENISSVRKIDFTGTINKFAGTDTIGYSGDGNPALLARIGLPTDVAADALGNVYITDQYNHVVRKVNAYGIISSFAGNGATGCNGDGLPAISAQIGRPVAIATDPFGNVYFTDVQHQVVRKVNTLGIISTVAGVIDTQGYSGDGGPATLAKLRGPQGIAADNSGNIYISDGGNNAIRRVNPAGIITTIAGDGTIGFGGDGGSAVSAKLNGPIGIALDGQNNLYIADPGNHRVRKIDAAGVISTVAGGDTTGYTGDGGPATAALLNGANDVATDGAGNVYISDRFNRLVRKINSTLSVSSVPADKKTSIYPNPCSGSFDVHLPIAGPAHLELVNSIGQTVYSVDTRQQDSHVDVPMSVANGLYLLHISTSTASEYFQVTICRQ